MVDRHRTFLCSSIERPSQKSMEKDQTSLERGVWEPTPTRARRSQTTAERRAASTSGHLGASSCAGSAHVQPSWHPLRVGVLCQSLVHGLRKRCWSRAPPCADAPAKQVPVSLVLVHSVRYPLCASNMAASFR